MDPYNPITVLVDYKNAPIRCRYCLATTHCVKDCQELIRKRKPGHFQTTLPLRRSNLDQHEPTVKRTSGQYTAPGLELDRAQLILKDTNKNRHLDKGKLPVENYEHDDGITVVKTKRRNPKKTRTPKVQWQPRKAADNHKDNDKDVGKNGEASVQFSSISNHKFGTTVKKFHTQTTGNSHPVPLHKQTWSVY